MSVWMREQDRYEAALGQEPAAEAYEASVAYEAAERRYNELDARCVELRTAADSVDAWQAYGQACRERAEAFQEVEAAWDRWVAARERAA